MAGTTSPGQGGARRASRSVRLTRRDRRRLRKAQVRSGGKRALRSSDAPVRAADPSAPAEERQRGGRRARRPPERRTRGLAGTLGLTFVGAVVPGTGYLFAKRRLAGVI